MSPRACGEIATRVAEACSDLDIRLTGHGLRSGLATESRRAGRDAKTIATQSCWRPNSAELYKYMQIDRWADSAPTGHRSVGKYDPKNRKAVTKIDLGPT